MKSLIHAMLWGLFCGLLACGSMPKQESQALSIQQWHTLNLDFIGPLSSETGTINPFLDYRMDTHFTSPSGQKYTVPGFFAADGEAGESGASSGHLWRVLFSPGEVGTWRYQVDFKKGERIAIANGRGKSAGHFDQVSGEFTVRAASESLSQKDFRFHGKLRYVGKHHLQFAGSGQYFLKAGANSPEVFLGYKDFDDTPTDRSYPAHIKDWREGDPLWHGIKGKGIIGVTNYLSALDNNVIYFLTMNVDGDGKQVWPWVSPEAITRYDVSKLAQWRVLFDHMISVGVMPHFVLTETENEHFFEWRETQQIGGFADSRKLYYREMVARFGYLLASTWNVGEENGWADPNSLDYGQKQGNSAEQRKQFATYLRSLMWEDEHVVIHNGPDRDYHIFEEGPNTLLGFKAYSGPSLQSRLVSRKAYEDTLRFRQLSVKYDHPWVVTLDEPYVQHKTPEPLDIWRKYNVWAVLMAGGAGLELYLGGGKDLTEENLYVYEPYYQAMAVANRFFQDHLPFWDMSPVPNALENGWLLAKAEEIYAVYLPEGGPFELTLPKGTYNVLWFSPTQNTMVTGQTIDGGAERRLTPPSKTSDQDDWVCVIKRP